MASDSGSPASKDEQLYMLELLVERLNLSSEKIQEIGSSPLSVRLDFLDFPTFEINEEEFWSATKRKEMQTTLSTQRKSKAGSLDLSAGKSCLFPKKPSELVTAMRSQPLKITVQKHTEKKICSSIKDDPPICKSEVPLSGCLCDQVAMAMNDPRHLPKPYTIRNTWNLIDDAGNPSGTILLFLRLTCLGKSIVTQFALQEKSFLFKSSNSPNEFQCSRVPIDNDDDDDDEWAKQPKDVICVPEGNREQEIEARPKPQSVIGLGPICEELANRDGGPLEFLPPIKRSSRPCMEAKNIIDCPGTRNIEKHRESKNLHSFSQYLLEQTQESECICPTDNIEKSVLNIFPCAGGLCSGASVCTRHVQNFGSVPNYSYKSRMRGGGRWEEPNDPCSKYGRNRIPAQSVETLASGACKPPMRSELDSSKPGCGCFGKLGTGAMGINPTTKSGACSNNPCLGIDCLIRAFKETQKFVDSIGKVPGLAGLGLMDPRESPFFGRSERQESPTTCGTKIAPNIPSGSTRSQQIRKLSDPPPLNTILPAPLSHTAIIPPGHRDHNVLQQDAISLVSGKTRKKPDDKTEKQKELHELTTHEANPESVSSPCKQTVCKSRKKKRQDDELNENSQTKLDEGKNIVRNKSTSSRMSRMRHARKSKSSSASVSSEKRHSSGPIRVSKRIMRLVDATQNPRFCHGHKNCQDVRLRVPGNMGWLWNTCTAAIGKLKTPLGWKPGAISKYVWDKLQKAKALGNETENSNGLDSRPGTPGKSKRGKALRSKSFHSMGRSHWARNRLDKDDDEVELPPTLHIHRKDGTYYVTMYPIKAEHINDPKLQEDVKPLQFKITKNKDDESACSSSTASDMEIEFSPPAAFDRYKKKAPVTSQETQVIEQEILDAVKVTNVKPETRKKGKIKK